MLMGKGSVSKNEGGRGSRNALFARTLFMNGPMGGQQMSYSIVQGKRGVKPPSFTRTYFMDWSCKRLRDMSGGNIK